MDKVFFYSKMVHIFKETSNKTNQMAMVDMFMKMERFSKVCLVKARPWDKEYTILKMVNLRENG